MLISPTLHDLENALWLYYQSKLCDFPQMSDGSLRKEAGCLD